MADLSSQPEPIKGRARRSRIPLVVGALVVIIAAVVWLAAATEQSIVCARCHEMAPQFASWSKSTHKEAACADCHVVGGLLTMLKLKYTRESVEREHALNPDQGPIQARVTDANCLKCHKDMPVVVSQSNVETTHAKHIGRGIDCTFCHQKAGHEPSREALSPGMPLCSSCHNGKQAPDRCDLCHKEEVEQPAPASHVTVEQGALQGLPHPPGYRTAHVEDAQKNLAGCLKCHQTRFCESCHSNRIPASHKQSGYRTSHNKDVAEASLDCTACHTQQFCLACHSQVRPRTHSQNWTKAHGNASQKKEARCSLCHRPEQCQDCHGMQMPHPAGYRRSHAAATQRNGKQCEKCHTLSYCRACHTTMEPRSHAAKDFSLAGHARLASDKANQCVFCHRSNQFCDACHSSTRPKDHQASDFQATGHGKPARQDRKRCVFCHSPGYCQNCHTSKRPPSHTDTWMATHGKPAAAGDSNCAFCHQRPDCTKCHGAGGTKPSSHGESYVAAHAADAKGRSSFCGLCHEAQYCNGCHKALQKPEIKFD